MMSGFSLAGLLSAFSGADTASGYKNFSFDDHQVQGAEGKRRGNSRHGHGGHSAQEADKFAFEKSSFQINLSKVGRSYLGAETTATGTDTESDPVDGEEEFLPFKNHGHQRRAEAFLDNLLRKLVTVFAIKILGDFLTALKGGASLDQISLDESQTDIAQATEDEESVVTVEEPSEDDGENTPPSLTTLSISVGLQIDITIGQQSQTGGILSTQTVEAENPLASDQNSLTDLVA